ncbi:ARF-binding protein, partial [Kickxella alabastrina]
YLVKNCGHAVHYQVASRDFLNDLFRRFPEFQPSQPNALHYRILEMLQEWRLTLCKRSRYKDDLQRIHDMYSLLRRKGWRFPEIDANAAAVVLGPVNTLKSRDEQEREDLDAMQAKLQELLRRATPKDLREANKLMKIITGYEQSSKRPDYDGEWEGKLKEIEVNVKVLLEMLQRVQPGDRLSDTVNELKAAVGSNQPRLRKLIAEMQQRPDGEELPEDEARDLARLASIGALVDEALSAHRDLQCGRAPLFSLSATASAAPEGELIMWDDAPEAPATGAAGAPRPSAPPKDATAPAARHKRSGYDAERRSEMGAAERRAARLLAMLGTAVPGEQMSAEIRRTRAECMASLAMLQELAQEQKAHARLNEDENRALAAMYMLRDRIQAALGAYEELKSGRRPQLAAAAAVPAK